MSQIEALAKRIQEAIDALESPARHGLTDRWVCRHLRETLALIGWKDPK